MNTEFKNRVFGCIIVKSTNSNFNADFTHQPRTLPDGVVYSTDKALKFTVRDFFRKYYPEDKIFYVKRHNEETLSPLTLDETYKLLFGEFEKTKKEEVSRVKTLAKLLECIDIRLFGATFAGSANIGIHGPVQINHGVNRFPENEIYTEDILSPFATDSDKQMSTIGNQTNLKEGHYVFHFSINPLNLKEFFEIANKSGKKDLCLSASDIQKLKRAFNSSVTALDTTRKINTENELTLWIQLKDDSKKMLPSLTELVDVNRKENSIFVDLTKVGQLLKMVEGEIESVELYYNPAITQVTGFESSNIIHHFNILNNKEIAHEYEAHIG
ncbi:MAG: type I CRISPR-associated protein Cas7 [Ignavibacteria bacterium]|jgi:CRISPR-associated protein Csh2|nr:type I CRISPR-associated protein Cas7 [Ignavibacteria bacterium]MCU7514495.1 type I CRISPR-associated protein Cas7 [Ignavibacteria bacterium]MCU7526500.1 type I CRISPR-associated protein Cas7 [Ignavibacteria bacterium]